MEYVGVVKIEKLITQFKISYIQFWPIFDLFMAINELIYVFDWYSALNIP